MDLKDWSSVVLVLFTIAPAVVFVFGSGIFLTGRPPSISKDTIGGFAVVSAVYAAAAISLSLFPWSFIDAAQATQTSKAAAFASLSWTNRLWGLSYIVVAPFLLGGILGALRRKGHFFRLMRLVRLDPVHPMPSAWDKMFSELPAGTPLVVTLKSGGSVIGTFGVDSAASNDAGWRDLYLERIKVPGGPPGQTRGIWLSPEQILSIETVHRTGTP